MTMQVQVVSPERILWAGEAEMVTARTIEGGDISFQTGHAPFVGALQIGKVIIRPGDADPVVFAVHGGFVEVSNNEVSLLTDVSESVAGIDVARAEAALQNAKSALAEGPLDPAAIEALRRAELRLEVAGAVSV
ncbi:ATP synthase F1 subunit epsilon [Aquihabitans sp. McL0605]|uniref:ATP synthase F1 subunit epsilon n=1 Tax=Aquihabitans sp. McL0605 TaxID=3415671 RepID=UPI003CF21AFC